MRMILLFFVIFIQTTATAKTIVFLGDSLTEGYGISKKQSYPQQLLQKLKSEGHKNLKIINASISGSTTASAPSRLRWFLKAQPDILVLALGANDGLRGLKTKATKKNLDTVIKTAIKKKITVILCGLRMPPNYGPDYQKQFIQIFSSLAKEHKLIFVPQLLKGVAGNPSLNQEDGIHPNEKGHLKMMKTIYPYIKRIL